MLQLFVPTCTFAILVGGCTKPISLNSDEWPRTPSYGSSFIGLPQGPTHVQLFDPTCSNDKLPQN
jgi:hypothetical protein